MREKRRKQFLSDITENILLPYEASTIYEEEIIGVFENQVESEFFREFVKTPGQDDSLLDLALSRTY